jgi:hypothetical protein
MAEYVSEGHPSFPLRGAPLTLTYVGLAASLAMLLASFAAFAAPDIDAVDDYIESEMQLERIPGLAVAIVQGDKVLHLRGFGQDGRGGVVTPHTSFILGSMSKSFTALAIMQLFDRGMVELDAPVQHYLPESGYGVIVLANVSSVLPLVPATHRIADNIALALTGRPLATAQSSFKLIYWVISIVGVLMLFSQFRQILRIGHWTNDLQGRRRLSVVWDVGSEILIPILVLVLLRQLLRVPFAEMLRSMPDIMSWLIIITLLGLILGVVKGLSVYNFVRER